jgi:hypothetical protein
LEFGLKGLVAIRGLGAALDTPPCRPFRANPNRDILGEPSSSVFLRFAEAELVNSSAVSANGSNEPVYEGADAAGEGESRVASGS